MSATFASAEPEALDIDALYTEHAAFLGRVIQKLAGDMAVEDLLQETFIVAWRRRAKLRPGAPVRPWLYGIASNLLPGWLAARAEAKVGLESQEDLEETSCALLIARGQSHEPVDLDEALSAVPRMLERLLEEEAGSRRPATIALVDRFEAGVGAQRQVRGAGGAPDLVGLARGHGDGREGRGRRCLARTSEAKQPSDAGRAEVPHCRRQHVSQRTRTDRSGQRRASAAARPRPHRHHPSTPHKNTGYAYAAYSRSSCARTTSAPFGIDAAPVQCSAG